ncbi:transcriptional regulator with XRE-family HTH domain [Ochrobactrum daejeonense]|uniref:Transcriptional regulator with XRE-family HTH domain n=1 Tax=Brucella daejeonensis TaxID=659015 RepID=A0A7W9EKG5_9HYPH|nr:XRE family transcriptional regulator [Brucella daejeonensis]MBB5701247.1 transcriptional regulator with XRE-family HTH domain [Brucella daejeonensis]
MPDADLENGSPSGGRQELGQKLRDLRLERGLTLQDVSKATDVARSTLSKIENGVMSPTFDILQKLAAGFALDIGALLSSTPVQQGVGRRSFTKNGSGPALSGKHYLHQALASDMSRKRILPFRTRVKARKLSDFKTLISHEGEVFLFVVGGTIMFHSDLYAPLRMEAGDSIYFDSKMAHAIISVSDEDADIIWVCDNIRGMEEADLELY